MQHKNKRIFVSFHHELNQKHADKIRNIIKSLGHQDISVNDGTKIENEDIKTDEQIRKEIRDKFLRDVDVTIVILGSDTINRKHIDWEIRSTLHKFDNKRQGSIVVINALTNEESWLLESSLVELHDQSVFPAGRSWPKNNEVTLEKFKWLPQRLSNSIVNQYNYENCLKGEYDHAVFPIISYNKVKNNINILQEAINQAINFKTKNQGKWDLNSKMRRKNNKSPDRQIFEQFSA